MRSGGKGASPGDLSLLFHIVKVVALVLFRSQNVDKPKLIEKLLLQLYRQMHVLSLDCIIDNTNWKVMHRVYQVSMMWGEKCFSFQIV